MSPVSSAANTVVAAAAAVAVLVVALATPASAHRNDESYLYLDVGDDSLSGRVEIPYPDPRLDLELQLVQLEQPAVAILGVLGVLETVLR